MRIYKRSTPLAVAPSHKQEVLLILEPGKALLLTERVSRIWGVCIILHNLHKPSHHTQSNPPIYLEACWKYIYFISNLSFPSFHPVQGLQGGEC